MDTFWRRRTKNKNIEISNTKSENLKINLPGEVENNKIHEYYSSEKVDLFFNFSTTEGLPVSMMEAQAYGIPILAPDIGGISEIVNEQTGFLVDVNSSILDLSKKILDISINTKELELKKKCSYENWIKNFNAESNYKHLVSKLLN